MNRHDRVREIIARLGGEKVVLEWLGLSEKASHMRMWVRRGFIPAEKFITLVQLATSRGVSLTCEELATHAVYAAGERRAEAAEKKAA